MGPAASLSDLLSDEGRRDPYRFYARLHERGEAVPLGPADRYAVVVCGYEAVNRILCDPGFQVPDADYTDRSGRWWRNHPVVRTLLTALSNLNGPDHARVRRVFSQSVTTRRVNALEPAITRITDRWLDRLAELGAGARPVDFMATFAVPLPLDVIGELVGVPEPDRAWFPPRVRDFDAVVELGPHSLRQVRAANVAAGELTSYFTELLASLIVMFNAGFRTAANMFGSGLALLIEHPQSLAALRADPSLAPSYIEEILRYEPPLHVAVRFATQDAQIAGVPVRAGQLVLILIAAANRDPRRFADPDEFVPTRRDNHHLTFGAGPHYCLGAALGRLEGKLALPRLLSRFPALTLAAEPGERRQLMLRGFDHLPVRLTDRTTVAVSLPGRGGNGHEAAMSARRRWSLRDYRSL